MDKFAKVRQAQAVIESRAAQDRETVRKVLQCLSQASCLNLFKIIETGKESDNQLHKMICILADIGVAQILSEWDDVEDPAYGLDDDPECDNNQNHRQT